MRKTALGISLLTGALLFPAVAGAQDRGWYGSASGSITLLDDTEGTIANTAPIPSVTTANSFETGFGAQAAIGYDFGRIRAEAEIGYSKNDQESYVAIIPPTGRIPADAEQTALRGMANVYVDIIDGPVQPYLGAGVGFARIDLTFVAARAPFPTEPPRELINDGATRLAYQLMGGVAVRVARSVSLTLQYRWFDAGSLALRDTRGEAVTRDHAGHNVDFGVRFRF